MLTVSAEFHLQQNDKTHIKNYKNEKHERANSNL